MEYTVQRSEKRNLIRKNHTAGILLSLLAATMIFLYAPIQLYVQNSDDFIYDLYDLLKMMLPVWGIAFIVSAAFLSLLNFFCEKLYRIVLGLYLAATIALYVEGNFLSGYLPTITGKSIDWGQYSAHRTGSVLLWIVIAGITVTGMCLLKGKKFSSLVSYIGGFGTALLALTLIFSLNGEATRDKADFYATTDHMFEMSSDRNFVLMILDTIDGVHFSDYLTENPKYEDTFEDFTFYNNALGTYPGTKWSIPFILSGTWFENQTGYYRFKENAYLESPLFRTVRESGYRMGLYQEDPPPAESLMEEFENLAKPDSENFMYPSNFRKMQIMLTGMSYLPFDLKKYCELTPDNIYYDSQKITSGNNYFKWGNDEFLKELESQTVTVADEPSFRMYVLQGTHDPYKDTIETAVADCFALIDEYIAALKKAGVYDNSVIVIMGDHGYFPSELYKMNPALFVKGIGEHHDFRVSDAPVSYADIPEAYLRLYNGAVDEEVFDAKNGELRERRFLNPYEWDDDHIIEMTHIGPASDVTCFTPTGTIYTPQ